MAQALLQFEACSQWELLGNPFPAFEGKWAQGAVALVENLKELDFHVFAKVSLNPTLSHSHQLVCAVAQGEAQQALKWKRVFPSTNRTEIRIFQFILVRTLPARVFWDSPYFKESWFFILKLLAGWFYLNAAAHNKLWSCTVRYSVGGVCTCAHTSALVSIVNASFSKC